MKRLILVAILVLSALPLQAAETEQSTAPPAAELSPANQPRIDTPAELFTPAPENLSTYITWSGGTCTAWLYCPGEPYWKCQSTTGNCQHTGCSITCNGNTRSCHPPPGYPACIEF